MECVPQNLTTKSVDGVPNQFWSIQKPIEFVHSWMDTQYFLRSYQFLILVMKKNFGQNIYEETRMDLIYPIYKKKTIKQKCG